MLQIMLISATTETNKQKMSGDEGNDDVREWNRIKRNLRWKMFTLTLRRVVTAAKVYLKSMSRENDAFTFNALRGKYRDVSYRKAD